MATLTREERRQWISRVRAGFQEGEIIKITYRHIDKIMMASKGDVAIATPGHLFIIVNLPYEKYRKIDEMLNIEYNKSLEHMDIEFETIKSNPERKFTLVKLKAYEAKYYFYKYFQEYKRSDVKDEVEIEGAKLILSEGIEEEWREDGILTIKWNNEKNDFEIETSNVKRNLVSKSRILNIEWEITDTSKPLGSFLNKHQELLKVRPSSVDSAMILIASDMWIRARARSKGIEIDVKKLSLPSEDELLECSKYYVIVIPRIILMENNPLGGTRTITHLDIYYKGRKLHAVLSWLPENMLFRCLRMRFSLTWHARRKLPWGVKNIDVNVLAMGDSDVERIAKWTRMIRDEILPVVRSTRSRLKRVEPIYAFAEVFYVKAPKRKIENVVRKWIEIFEKVKDLAPDATLYVTFYGQQARDGRRKLPNYVGYIIKKNGLITVMNSRYFPASGITLRGGEFERAYREVYVEKLFEYQILPVIGKLEMLWEDILEARHLVEEAASAAAADMRLSDFEAKLKELALRHRGDNIVLITLKYLYKGKIAKRPPKGVDLTEARRLLVGLAKTGTREDLNKLVEYGVLKVIRVAMKYEIKHRGYSLRKGVVFIGDPERVRRKILRVVKKIKGRLLALMEEFAEAPIEQPELVTKLSRVEALLEF